MVQATSQQEFSDADFRVVDNANQSKKLVSGTQGATPTVVILAQAGTQGHTRRPVNSTLGSRLRGNDVVGWWRSVQRLEPSTPAAQDSPCEAAMMSRGTP
jgi:hypothetical protein